MDPVDGVLGLEDFGRFPETRVEEKKLLAVFGFVRPDFSAGLAADDGHLQEKVKQNLEHSGNVHLNVVIAVSLTHDDGLVVSAGNS